jgi:hypothetical protein
VPSHFGTPAGSGNRGYSAARHVAGSGGSPQQPYFTRTPISRALLFNMKVTQPRSPMSRRSLVWKLGAAALFKVSCCGAWLLLLNVACLSSCWSCQHSRFSKGTGLRAVSRRSAYSEPVDAWDCNQMHSCRSPNEVFSNNSSLQELSIWSHCHGPTRPFSAPANQALVDSMFADYSFVCDVK